MGPLPLFYAHPLRPRSIIRCRLLRTPLQASRMACIRWSRIRCRKGMGRVRQRENSPYRDKCSECEMLTYRTVIQARSITPKRRPSCYPTIHERRDGTELFYVIRALHAKYALYSRAWYRSFWQSSAVHSSRFFKPMLQLLCSL